MNDVRRGNVTGVYDVTRSGSSMFRGIKFDQCDDGTHALMPWEEYERLRKVVDAVRDVIFESRVTIMGTIETQWAVVEALRELEESDV